MKENVIGSLSLWIYICASIKYVYSIIYILWDCACQKWCCQKSLFYCWILAAWSCIFHRDAEMAEGGSSWLMEFKLSSSKSLSKGQYWDELTEFCFFLQYIFKNVYCSSILTSMASVIFHCWTGIITFWVVKITIKIRQLQSSRATAASALAGRALL